MSERKFETVPKGSMCDYCGCLKKERPLPACGNQGRVRKRHSWNREAYRIEVQYIEESPH